MRSRHLVINTGFQSPFNSARIHEESADIAEPSILMVDSGFKLLILVGLHGVQANSVPRYEVSGCETSLARKGSICNGQRLPCEYIAGAFDMTRVNLATRKISSFDINK